MSNEITTMDDMQKMGLAMVKSKLFGFENIEQAMSIMLIAQAEGRHPALAARDYHVIQGRPALKADAMLARFQAEGGVVEWREYSDEKVTGAFSHPKSCPKPVAITWTMEQAKRIGLARKDNWAKYPRAMLRARVISEGVRTAYPGIAVGIYTVEEVHDLTPEKDITPTSGAGESLTEERRIAISELADAVREWLNQGSLTDAYCEIDNAALDPEEKIYLWTHFDSKIRRQLKEEAERQRIKADAKVIESKVISDGQRKRLEARIGELGLDRHIVKATCVSMWGKEHFADLSADEYNRLDSIIESMPPKAAPPQNPEPATVGEAPPALVISAQGAATLAPEDHAIANIGKAIDADTLMMAVDTARSVCKTAPAKLRASEAYRKRLAELKSIDNEGRN